MNTTTQTTDYSKLSISEITRIIRRDWKKVYFGAVPYLQAMSSLESVNDNYINESGRSIVLRFLGNAQTWKGQIAREVKKELNKRVK